MRGCLTLTLLRTSHFTESICELAVARKFQERMACPLWSPDGRERTAIDAVSQWLFLVDVKTGNRTQLSQSAVHPIWSADSQYLYYSSCFNPFRARLGSNGDSEPALSPTSGPLASLPAA
jgi:hypothetical protein